MAGIKWLVWRHELVSLDYQNHIHGSHIVLVILTLYGPNSFFRRFSGHNLR